MIWLSNARRVALRLCALACFASAGAAHAGPGDTREITGASEVTLIEPVGLQNVEDLRFGRMIQPETSGTVTITPAGNATAGGGMAGNIDTAQITNGRGAGIFAAFGDPNRFFYLYMQNTNIAISSGDHTMQVDQFRTTAIFQRFDRDGFASIRMGARLNVEADQAPGDYTGTYVLSIYYF